MPRITIECEKARFAIARNMQKMIKFFQVKTEKEALILAISKAKSKGIISGFDSQDNIKAWNQYRVFKHKNKELL